MTIAGRASLRLLPTPVVSFTDVRIGDVDVPDVEMERFRAEVELMPLLSGTIRILQMTVERPRMNLDLADLEAGTPSPGWRIDPERISLARLDVSDGSVLVSDTRAGRTWQADNITAVIEAGSLRGPARIDAELALDGRPLSIRASLGRVGDDGALPTKLTVHSPLMSATLNLDGTIRAGAAPAFSGAVLSGPVFGGPVFAGKASFSGEEPEDDEEPRSAWADLRATSVFELSPAMLTLSEAEIGYGPAERAVTVRGDGTLALGRDMRFRANLKARQIDVDRALGGGPDHPVSIAAAMAALTEMRGRASALGVPGELHFDAAGVVVGGDVIQAVGADLLTDGRDWQVETFAAMLPGDTRIDLSGAFEPVSGNFRGHAKAASRRPATMAAWLSGSPAAKPVAPISAEADMELGDGAQKLTGLTATLGEGRITGDMQFHRFEQSQQRFASVTLSADRADLLQARALWGLLGAAGSSLAGFDQLAVALKADVLSVGDLEARSVVLDGGLADGRLELRRLRVDDLAGATVDARGSVSDPFGAAKGRIDASVNAADLSGAAAFLAGLLPEDPMVARLRAIAPRLSPVNADVTLDTQSGPAPLALDVAGTFAETHLRATAKGKGAVWDPAGFEGMLHVHLDADDTAAFLTQLGVGVLPVRAGAVSVDLDALGSLRDSANLALKGTAAGIAFDYSGRLTAGEGGYEIGGALQSAASDIDPALFLAGLTVPGLGEGRSASVAGAFSARLKSLGSFAGGSARLAVADAKLDGQTLAGSLELSGGDRLALKGSLTIPELSLPFVLGFPLDATVGLENATWSRAPFAATLPEALGVALDLQVGTLDLGAALPARDAKLAVTLASDALNVDLTSSTFAGGRLKGAFAAKVAGGEADATIRANLEAADLAAIGWERGGLPIASGTLDLSVDAKAKGRSVGALVATLSGNGAFALRDGRINALNPEALTAVLAAADSETEPTDEAAREIFATRFGSGAFAFGGADGSFTLGGGIAKFATVSLSGPGATVLADASLDFNDLSVRSLWSVRGAKAPAPPTNAAATGDASAAGKPAAGQPRVDIAFSGPIAEPERRADLQPLLEQMHGRFLQRQLDELDRLEKERKEAEAESQRLAAQRAAEAAAARAAAEQAAAAEAAARDSAARAAAAAAAADPPTGAIGRAAMASDGGTAGAAPGDAVTDFVPLPLAPTTAVPDGLDGSGGLRADEVGPIPPAAAPGAGSGLTGEESLPDLLRRIPGQGDASVSPGAAEPTDPAPPLQAGMGSANEPSSPPGPARLPARSRAATTEAPPPPALPASRAAPAPRSKNYKTLPNGVTVKIR